MDTLDLRELELRTMQTPTEIETTWNRMTEPIVGRFNPAYTTRANDNDWSRHARSERDRRLAHTPYGANPTGPE
jgi:hypothetical protein